jgi:hypothetical protein
MGVLFREEDNPERNRTSSYNPAWLKRFGSSLLKQQNDKPKITMRRRLTELNVDYPAQVPVMASIDCAVTLATGRSRRDASTTVALN